jgi:phosphoribosylformimino-5-aminoimidazole carboxamide ribotide isomerase
MRLIPSIDLRGGQCVRLYQGDFGRETRYDASPREQLARYRGLGADWVHVVDLDAARDGGTTAAGSAPGCPASANRSVIAALAAESELRLQVGGGIRSEAALAGMLELGAARAVVGSAALAQAADVRAWIGRFGPDRVVLAFDVRLDEGGMPRVATHGWQRQSNVSLWDAVAGFAPARLRHVLCTDVSRDGALAGPNVGLYAEAVRRFPDILWQASGGIRDASDLAALAGCGAAAAISGKALLENRIAAEDLRPFLPNV